MSEKVKPKQRRRRVNLNKMGSYMVVAAMEGYAMSGKVEIDLDKCAVYKLREADE